MLLQLDSMHFYLDSLPEDIQKQQRMLEMLMLVNKLDLVLILLAQPVEAY